MFFKRKQIQFRTNERDVKRNVIKRNIGCVQTKTGMQSFLSLDNNWLWHYLYYIFLIFFQLNFSQKRTHLLAADVLSNDVTKRKTKKKAFLFNILVLSFLSNVFPKMCLTLNENDNYNYRMHLTNPIIGQPKLCLSRKHSFTVSAK